jgi:uncharacterized membrane protein YhfC
MAENIVGTQAITAFILLIICGIVLPVAGAAVWKIKTKEPISTILIGAGTFLAFAIILKNLAAVPLVVIQSPVQEFIINNAVVYTLIGAVMAGLFEETGRFVALKFLLKKRTNRETAISCGIGHGGFEAMYLLAGTGVQYLGYTSLVNSGQLSALVDTLNSVTIANVGISLLERVSAVLIHISCSIIVFAAVNVPKKRWLYPLAIVIHTVVDIIPGLYSFGLITSTAAIEIILLAEAVILFVLTLKFIYLKLPVTSENLSE